MSEARSHQQSGAMHGLSEATPSEPLQAATSPVGERIPLKNGLTLERLNPVFLAELQAQDPRIQYFAADAEIAAATPRGLAYYRAVTDHIGARVAQDFAGVNVAVRGTVAALETPYPYWPDGDTVSDMRTLTEILATGSDKPGDLVRVGFLGENGALNYQTEEWLNSHYQSVMLEMKGEPELDQTFPVLLVYEPEAFERPPGHGWNRLAGEPSQCIAAAYITDKMVL